jgi:hypothetical protein
MVKKILTRFAVAKKAADAGKAVYRSPRIYLPTKLTDDSVFPFKEGDLLLVRVDRRKLVVQKMRKSFGAANDQVRRDRNHKTD